MVVILNCDKFAVTAGGPVHLGGVVVEKNLIERAGGVEEGEGDVLLMMCDAFFCWGWLVDGEADPAMQTRGLITRLQITL